MHIILIVLTSVDQINLTKKKKKINLKHSRSFTLKKKKTIFNYLCQNL